MKNYADVKQTLYDMLEELNGRLAKITDEVKHTDQPVEKDFAEQATQAENDQVLDYLGNAARAEVHLIEQAIARIDSGEYGQCKVCGEPIWAERLRALPYSSLCIRCAKQKE